MPFCQKSIDIWLANELNHRDRIYKRPNKRLFERLQSGSTSPIRSLREEQSKSSARTIDIFRGQTAGGPVGYSLLRARRGYGTNFDHNRLLDDVGFMSERGERDKKCDRSHEYQPSLWELRARKRILSISCRSCRLCVIEGGGEKARHSRRRGSSLRCISWIKKVIYLAVSRRAGAVGV